MTTYLPEIYERFSAEFPSVMTAYTALAESSTRRDRSRHGRGGSPSWESPSGNSPREECDRTPGRRSRKGSNRRLSAR
jgi:hypothetical protein